MSDVVVAGGGVIGLSIAWEAARRGARVTVIDQARCGREASWAGAGFFPPGNLRYAKTPAARLRAFSHRLWPDWSDRLQQQTGIDTGYRVCGGLTVSRDQSLDSVYSEWNAEGVAVQRLSPAAVREIEPAIDSGIHEALHLPELAQVRNPRHLKALRAACDSAGVEFLEGCPVIGWERGQRGVIAARTTHQRVSGDEFVVAAGAWSSVLLADAGCPSVIEPVRGQIVLLRLTRPLFRHVLEEGRCYLVPRPDGRVLIGATEERAGFVKQNTVSGVSGLLEFATSLVPALAGAEVERCWSGLRPHAGGGLPLIGRLPDVPNVIAATGHFRSGLQLSPGTAVLIGEILSGQAPSLEIDAFGPDRLESPIHAVV